MWCPECGCEYVEGITVCADCGCELTEEKEPVKRAQEEAEFSGFEMEEGAAYEEVTGEDFSFEEEKERPARVSFYVNNEEKAEENKSSAYTLLIVGGAGLIAVILFFTGVIPLQVALLNKYMISGVMGALFLLFIIMGIVSMRNSKILAGKAGKENNLTGEIRKWCFSNLSGEKIDAELGLSGETGEIMYFQRFEYVKKLIQNQFLNLDEGYLDRLVDEIYGEIFGE